MAWLQVSFFSNELQRNVPLQILIPSDNSHYQKSNPKEKFKTIYLLHGYLEDCTNWLLNGDVNTVSQEYNLCIVMPSGCNNFYVDAPNGANNYSRFISTELVDFTRRLLPLSERREDTIIGGLSMGGYGALFNGLLYSKTFGHILSLSPPMIFDRNHLKDLPEEPHFMGICKGYYQEVFMEDLSMLPDSIFDIKNIAHYSLEKEYPLPDIYLACGFNDRLKEGCQKLCKDFNDLGIKYTYEEGPGSHEWAFWKPYLRRGLEHALSTTAKKSKNPFWTE